MTFPSLPTSKCGMEFAAPVFKLFHNRCLRLMTRYATHEQLHLIRQPHCHCFVMGRSRSFPWHGLQYLLTQVLGLSKNIGVFNGCF